jgi:hypothetical protein
MLPTEVARLFFFGEAEVEGPSSRMSSAQQQWVKQQWAVNGLGHPTQQGSRQAGGRAGRRAGKQAGRPLHTSTCAPRRQLLDGNAQDEVRPAAERNQKVTTRSGTSCTLHAEWRRFPSPIDYLLGPQARSPADSATHQ